MTDSIVRETIKNNKNAIVLLYNPLNQITTTGFFVSGHYIITTSDIATSWDDEINVQVVNYLYHGRIIGLDKEGNMAMLELVESLRHFKTLKWGKSPNCHTGDLVLAIDFESITFERLTSTKTLHPGIPGELMTINNSNCRNGTPVVDIKGAFVGMMYRGFIISEYFLRRPIKALGKVSNDKRYSEFVEDGHYIKSFLGLKARPFDLPDVLKESKERKITGFILLEVPEEYSEFLEVGDVITHMEDKEIGKYKFSPMTILWKILPGKEIRIRYRKIFQSYGLENQTTIKTKPYVEHLETDIFYF